MTSETLVHGAHFNDYKRLRTARPGRISHEPCPNLIQVVGLGRGRAQRGIWPCERKIRVTSDFMLDSLANLAPPAGFEPATHGLGNRRSIP
jgi:hypothetical protein